MPPGVLACPGHEKTLRSDGGQKGARCVVRRGRLRQRAGAVRGGGPRLTLPPSPTLVSTFETTASIMRDWRSPLARAADHPDAAQDVDDRQDREDQRERQEHDRVDGAIPRRPETLHEADDPEAHAG